MDTRHANTTGVDTAGMDTSRVDAAATGPSIGMVAGETSGDLLAAAVLRGMRARAPGLRTAGVGGPAMVREGFDAWWPSELLAVHGYAEALRHYPRLRRLRNELGDRLIAERPALFVGVDAPDFNLGLETRLRRAGIRTAHFIGPSIWAWRGGRIKGIKEAVDRILVVFPFEPPIYERAGIPVSYVGHPLADAIPLEVDRAAARTGLARDAGMELPADAPLVALLPGSRRGEVHHMGRTFIEAAGRMLDARPSLRFALPAATATLRAALAAVLDGRDGGAPLPARLRERLALVDGHSHAVLAACDAALVASGTATLETALFRKPMVIAYRMAPLSWRIMRRMNYLPWAGLPNILCGETVVPEFLQDAATPEALAAATLAQLDDDANRDRLAARFAELHRTLRVDCAARAAQALLETADAR